jgi:hypothetical protein
MSGNRAIIKNFEDAIRIMDSGSEDAIRLLIESDLCDVAGPNSTKRNQSQKVVADLMKKISVVRVKAIKDAFKHLRATLPHLD